MNSTSRCLKSLFEFRQLDQGQDHQVVGGRGQAVFFRTLDHAAAGDEPLALLVIDLVLEFDDFWPLGTRSVSRAIGNSAKVHLVLAGGQGEGAIFESSKEFEYICIFHTYNQKATTRDWNRTVAPRSVVVLLSYH